MDKPLLQTADPFQVPFLRRREDPLPQTPYVFLGGPPVNSVPVQEFALRSVHHGDSGRHRRRLRRHGVQLALRFRCRFRVPTQAHLTRVSTLSGPGTRPVSGQLPETAGEGADHAVPVSCRLSAARHSLLGPSATRPGIGPSSRSAYRTLTHARTLTGLPRSTRTNYDRGGCLLYPGGGGAHPADKKSSTGACRSSTASPYTPLEQPISEAHA